MNGHDVQFCSGLRRLSNLKPQTHPFKVASSNSTMHSRIPCLLFLLALAHVLGASLSPQASQHNGTTLEEERGRDTIVNGDRNNFIHNELGEYVDDSVSGMMMNFTKAASLDPRSKTIISKSALEANEEARIIERSIMQEADDITHEYDPSKTTISQTNSTTPASRGLPVVSSTSSFAEDILVADSSARSLRNRFSVLDDLQLAYVGDKKIHLHNSHRKWGLKNRFHLPRPLNLPMTFSTCLWGHRESSQIQRAHSTRIHYLYRRLL